MNERGREWVSEGEREGRKREWAREGEGER